MIHHARFVGGKADGRTYAFPGMPPRYFKVAVMPPARFLWDMDPTSIEPIAIEHENYRLHCLIGRDRDFWVYSPDEWSLDDIYEHLLFGNGAILSER